MSNNPTQNCAKKPAELESGFSLLEVIIAIFILSTALIGTAAAITYALEFGTTSRNVGKAKLVIISTIEEIEALRNARRLDFKQISNVGDVDNADSKNTFNGFSLGFKEISLDPGPDGVIGTDDDLKDAGDDGIYGTGDEFDNPALVRSGYLRQISISFLPTDPTIKKVEVRVKYFSVGGKVSEISGVSYINDESRRTG